MESAFLNHFLGLVIYAVCFLPVTPFFYAISCKTIRKPVAWNRLLPYAGLTVASWSLNRLITMYANGLNMLATIATTLLVMRVIFQCRGWDLLWCTLKYIVLVITLELICAVLLFLAENMGIPSNQILVVTLEDLFNPFLILRTALLNILGTLPLLALLTLWERLHNRKKSSPEVRRQRWLYTRPILRLALLIVGAMVMLSMPHYLFGENSLLLFTIPSKEKYIVLILSVLLVLGVAISYAAQDIRYLLQLQRLNTLEQQQAISNSLLQNLRFFRHNMVNMLYGLEGVLISGDRDKVTAYYNEMREKCALVNNENILALERVANPSISAILLHGVDKARQLNLPINLYVQEQVQFGRTLSDADLCQVLGVLLDNAIEAADKAEERHVTVELRNVENSLEVIVKNTYAGEVSPEKLTMGGASTKEGHEGQGLRSCYHILSRRKGAFLNFWVTGQYVQAQLLLGR